MLDSPAVREVREMADRYYNIPGSEGEAAALHGVLDELATAYRRLGEAEKENARLRDELEQQDAQLGGEIERLRHGGVLAE